MIALVNSYRGARVPLLSLFILLSSASVSAALVVSSNDAKKPIKNILLRANAKPPVLSSGPNTISFGVLPVTQSLTKTITLTNRGLSDLEIYDISIEDDLEGNFDYVKRQRDHHPRDLLRY